MHLTCNDKTKFFSHASSTSPSPEPSSLPLERVTIPRTNNTNTASPTAIVYVVRPLIYITSIQQLYSSSGLNAIQYTAIMYHWNFSRPNSWTAWLFPDYSRFQRTKHNLHKLLVRQRFNLEIALLACTVSLSRTPFSLSSALQPYHPTRTQKHFIINYVNPELKLSCAWSDSAPTVGNLLPVNVVCSFFKHF